MTSSRVRSLFHILSGILLCHVVFSQEPVNVERSDNKVILEGKIYYIHVVKPGQTLYSISRAYDVSEKEIAIENPGVMSGIQIGQALKIPLEPSLEEPETDGAEEGEKPAGQKIHTVRRGETVYSIARHYGIGESRLLEANPDVDIDDLQPGRELVIPEPAEKMEEPSYNEEGFVYRKVKRRETLYSIAREYRVGVEEIRNANPELEWGGPKAGQVIRIPVPQVIDHPEAVMDTVPADSVPEAEADKWVEAYRYDELRFGHEDLDRTYRVVFLVPFDFREPEPLDSLLKEVRSASRRNRITERYRQEQRVPQSVNFLEFFQGALLAVDSVRKTGMRMDIRFFDTRKSPDRTRELLKSLRSEPPDLIIGPFYPFNLEAADEFARRHHIPVVTPFHSELELVRRNPYLFQLSPSLETEYRKTARLVASKHRYNIVYVREEDSLDVERHAYFKERIFEGFDEYRPEEPVVFKEVVLSLGQTGEIIHSLTQDRKNLVVVPTRNEALAARVVSTLYYELRDYDIELVGTVFWPQFTSIDYRYYHELGLTFYSTFWVDYSDSSVTGYLNRYRNHFFNEPQSTTRKGINYGIIGHDMTFYFLNALRLHGSRFILNLDEYDPGLVQGPLHFRRVSVAGGYENERIGFYRFQPDMSIREIQVPLPPPRRFFFRPFEDRERRYLRHELKKKEQ